MKEIYQAFAESSKKHGCWIVTKAFSYSDAQIATAKAAYSTDKSNEIQSPLCPIEVLILCPTITSSGDFYSQPLNTTTIAGRKYFAELLHSPISDIPSDIGILTAFEYNVFQEINSTIAWPAIMHGTAADNPSSIDENSILYFFSPQGTVEEIQGRSNFLKKLVEIEQIGEHLVRMHVSWQKENPLTVVSITQNATTTAALTQTTPVFNALVRVRSWGGPSGLFLRPAGQLPLPDEDILLTRRKTAVRLSKLVRNYKTKGPKGLPHIISLTGESGVGKTLLAKQVAIAIGKCNPDKNNPYEIFSTIIRTRLNEILKNPLKKNMLKPDITSAVGDNIALFHPISELSKFFDEGEFRQKASLLSPANPQEHEARIHRGFAQLISILAEDYFSESEKTNPLVLLLDDIQWIDPASKRLLIYLSQFKITAPLVILLVSRDPQLIEEIPHQATLIITNLDQREITHWLNHAFSDVISDTEETKELANVFYKKTQGNPFLIKNMIAFIKAKNFPSIRQIVIEMDPQQFLQVRLMGFSTEEIQLLKYFACLGNSFYFEKNQEFLEKLCAAGILNKNSELVESNYYTFSHDKIYSSIYALLTAEEKVSFHYMIGNALKIIHPRIFEAVYHLHIGRPAMGSNQEIHEFAGLNVKAAQLAMAQAAWQQALDFLAATIEVLDRWWDDEEYYKTVSTTYRLIAQNNLALGNIEEAQRIFTIILTHAAKDEDRLFAYLGRFKIFSAQFNFHDANEASTACLRIGNLNHLNDIEKRKKVFDLQLIELLSTLIFNAYFAINHADLIKYVEIARHISAANPYNNFEAMIAVWHAFSCLIQDDIPQAIACAMQAKALLAAQSNSKEQELAHLILGAMLLYLNAPFKDCINFLQKGKDISFRTGNKLQEIFCGGNKLLLMFFADKSLATIETEYEQISRLAEKYCMQSALNIVSSCYQLTRALKTNASMLPNFSRATLEQELLPRRPLNADGFYLHFLLQEKYYLARDTFPTDDFIFLLEEAEKTLRNTPGFIHTIEHYFYKALILATLFRRPDTHEPQKSNLKHEMQYCLDTLLQYKKSCSQNFKHKYLLIEAELLDIAGFTKKSNDKYLDAIERFDANNFLRLSALSCELYASYLERKNPADVIQPNHYRQQSLARYKNYGAKHIGMLVQALQRQNSQSNLSHQQRLWQQVQESLTSTTTDSHAAATTTPTRV